MSRVFRYMLYLYKERLFPLWRHPVVLIMILFLLVFILIANVINFKSSHVIELREDGFYPREITIQKGDTVTFKTIRKRPFWPASTYHPLHDLYPTFDSREPVASNSLWNFTFDKIGIWGYHDHLDPRQKGKVIVLDPSSGFKKKKDLLSACAAKEKISQSDCVIVQIAAVIESGTPEDAYTLLEKPQIVPDFERRCHSLAHYLGEIAYEKYRTGSITIKPDPRFNNCANGFYHGFIESMFFDQGNALDAGKFCYDISKKRIALPNTLEVCLHGLGHGFTDMVSADEWENSVAVIDRPLQYCRYVGRTEKDMGYCVDGVFHSISKIYQVGYKTPIKADDPLSICDKQEKLGTIFQTVCYENFVTVLLRNIAQGNFTTAAEYLSRIKDTTMARRATANLAVRFLIHFLKNEERTTNILLHYCRTVPDVLHVACISGFAIGLMMVNPETNEKEEYTQSIILCSQENMPAKEQEICFSQIGWNAFQRYTSSQHKEFCASVPLKYRYFCPGGPAPAPKY